MKAFSSETYTKMNEVTLACNNGRTFVFEGLFALAGPAQNMQKCIKKDKIENRHF